MTVAAEVLRELPDGRAFGVRLDSGDLAALALTARRALDAASLPEARVIVSGGLDEYDIADLVAARAPVDAFAVGTKVGTSADAPYLDSAYKLVEYDGRPVMKLSAKKLTSPGAKQVFRGAELADVIALRDEAEADGTEPLLVPVMSGGRRTGPRPTPQEAVAAARARLAEDLAALPASARAIRQPVPPTARWSTVLLEVTDRLRRELETSPRGAGAGGRAEA